LLSIDEDYRLVVLKDLTTDKERHRLKGHEWPVHALAFSPDGKFLSSGSWDQTVRLWDLSSGKEALRLVGGQYYIQQLAFSPDGKLLAAVSAEDDMLHSFRLWETATGKELSPPAFQQQPVASLAVSPNGQQLATGSSDGKVRLWETSSRKLICCLGTDPDRVSSIAFSPDGKFLLAAMDNSSVHIWEVVSGKAVDFPQNFDDRDFALSPAGAMLATSTLENGPISLWDFPPRKVQRQLQPPHHCRQLYLSFAPDGTLLVSSGWYEGVGHLVLWETATGKRRLWIKEEGGAIAIAPNNKILAMRSSDYVKLWDIAAGRTVQKIEPPGSSHVSDAVFSPDGRMLATGGGSGNSLKPGDTSIHLWEVATGQPRCSFRGHHATVRGLAFFPDGRRLASGSEDTTALVWDIERAVLGETPRRPLSSREADQAWTDLSASDARRAFRSLLLLSSSAAQAVALVSEHVRPTGGPPLARLVAALDSDQFEERERASQALAKRGPDAEAILRRTLAGQPSLEARHRLESLIDKLDKAPMPTEYLLHLRAVELLEWVHTPEANRELKALAEGDADSGLAQEAKAALRRLAKQAMLP
jgi:WD40 repeat protein